MKKTQLLICLLIPLSLLHCNRPGEQKDQPQSKAESSPNILTAQEKSDGWKLLFDGKTTAGWRGAHRHTFPDSGWSIENGGMMCSISSFPITYFC